MSKTNRPELSRARQATQDASRAYKAAWRKDPGPKGYPAVDRALDALQVAERSERELLEALT